MNTSDTTATRPFEVYVSYQGKEEAARLYAWLDAHGYKNVQRLDPETYTFPVVCVDSSGVYFGTNTTCMAGAVSCGKRRHLISVAEFIARESGKA